ncbi:unnamed protein product, partial [Arctogadus glacialis]
SQRVRALRTKQMELVAAEGLYIMPHLIGLLIQLFYQAAILEPTQGAVPVVHEHLSAAVRWRTCVGETFPPQRCIMRCRSSPFSFPSAGRRPAAEEQQRIQIRISDNESRRGETLRRLNEHLSERLK